MDNAEALGATELGWLQGGRSGAVMAGLAMLHARGLLTSGVGSIRRTGTAPQDAEPLERTLYLALYSPIGPRELASKKGVQRALREMQQSLVERGLARSTGRRVLTPVLLVALPPAFLAHLVALEVVGVIEGLVGVVAVAGTAVWFMPRRTVAGERALAAARHRYGDLIERSRLEPEEVGRAVGLFGTAALHALIPRFAREAGLLDGGRSSNHIDNRLDSSPWSPSTDSFWN